MSYELLYSLNEGMEMLLTGPDTDPTTLATAITALQSSLTSLSSTNDTISVLDTIMVMPDAFAFLPVSSAFYFDALPHSLLLAYHPAC